MNAAHGTMLGLMIVMGGWSCAAQNAAIPFKQLEKNAQLNAKLEVPGNETAVSNAVGSPPEASYSAGFTRSTPTATVRPRILTRGFFLLNALHLVMAVADVEMTQHCIADHHCKEGNPVMPSSLAGQLGVSIGFVGTSGFASYEVKKRRSSIWWLSPTVGIVAHSVGLASGIEHR